jgi:sugar phosphate isomerase/epimerase
MPSFIYCLNSSTIKPAPIMDKIRIAGDEGYAAIELWHDDIDAHLARGGTLREIRQAAADAGLNVPTTIFLKGWWDTTGAVYNRALDEIKRRLGQAAEVGATYSIAGPPLGAIDFTVGAERYRQLLEIGRPFGVKPAMEYLGFADEVHTIEAALTVMDGSGQADATIVLDPFHCFRGGGPMESIRKLPAARIAISHFNDSPGFPARELQQDPDRVLPGDGIVDLRAYCGLLREVGYDRWLSLELFRRDLWARDPREVARIGLEKMRAVAEA